MSETTENESVLSRFAGSSRRLRAVVTCLIGIILVIGTGYSDESISYFSSPAMNQTASVARTLVREVGFALVVAVIIWTVFEYFAREENESLWKERAQQIAENVFYGVLRRRLPSDYISAANRLILSPQFLRSGWELRYRLRTSHFVHKTGRMPFVILNCDTRFQITNITEQLLQYPIRLSLPSPMHQRMKEIVGVSGIVLWRKGIKIVLDLEEPSRHLREQLETESFQIIFTAGSIDIHPQETIEVAMSFTIAKQAEDSEVVQGSYPADSVRIIIDDQEPASRVIGARSIHADALDEITMPGAEGTRQFKIGRYLLPHNGFVFWWKSAEIANSPQHVA